jgi:eukaryotic-like serine/threonine-protein kinase
MREIVIGEKLDQYQLSELLARSGMASIFKAVDMASGQPVVLKIPHPELESDVVFYERFRREEAIGQRLDHPYLVKVLRPREKSRMYMAMEFVDGRSLRAVVQESRALPVERALEIARQVTEGLIYLHAHGVVHRDIKPENILLVGDHGLKLIDFGIALDDSARRLTWAGLSTTMGTPDYMAPEQVGGRRGDARTDVYAVGMLLYEMVSGHLPFENPNPQAALRAKMTEDPRPPSYFVPTLDPALEAIILKAISRAPRERHDTAAELLSDLLDPAAAALRAPETERGRGPARPLRRMVVPVAVVSVLLGLAALVWLSQRPAGSSSAPSAAPTRERD